MSENESEKAQTEARAQAWAPGSSGLSPLEGILGRVIERRLRAIRSILEDGALFESEDIRNATFILIDSAIKLARRLFENA